MKIKRILSSLVLFSLILSGCAGDISDDTANDTSADTSIDTAPAFSEPVPDIPDDLRFDGETVRLYTMENTLGVTKEEYNQEYAADLVVKANYERMLAVEERFGVTVELINTDVYSEMPGMIRQSVNSNSDDYDIAWCCASYFNPLIYEGFFLGVDELPYVDLEKPWWAGEYINSVSIDPEYPYILFGDINWNYIQRSTCTYFNMRLMEDEVGLTADEVYDIVLNGDWTIEKMYELQKGMYRDTDGSTTANDGDIFGFVHAGNWFFEYMMFGSGLEFTSRDDDGYPMLTLNNERTVDCIDAVGKMFWNNEDSYMSTDYAKIFGRGEALFLVNRLFLCVWDELRNMKDDYGIIPVPKLNAEDEGYHCVVEQLVQWGCVPVTVQNTDMVSAVAEFMAYEGYKNVTPAYYDVSLKFKYTRGDSIDKASQIIDMIRDGARCDFMYINQLNGMETIFGNIWSAGQNNFTSLYASLESAANTKIGELIATVSDRAETE